MSDEQSFIDVDDEVVVMRAWRSVRSVTGKSDSGSSLSYDITLGGPLAASLRSAHTIRASIRGYDGTTLLTGEVKTTRRDALRSIADEIESVASIHRDKVHATLQQTDGHLQKLRASLRGLRD